MNLLFAVLVNVNLNLSNTLQLFSVKPPGEGGEGGLSISSTFKWEGLFDSLKMTLGSKQLACN